MFANVLFAVAGFCVGMSITWLLMSWPDGDPWETDRQAWDDSRRHDDPWETDQ